MLNRIIEWAVGNKLLVALFTVGAIFGGIRALQRTPLDTSRQRLGENLRRGLDRLLTIADAVPLHATPIATKPGVLPLAQRQPLPALLT